MIPRPTWWLLVDPYDEVFVTWGVTEDDALAHYRRDVPAGGDVIVYAGGLTNAEANLAHEAWNDGDQGTAQRLRARYLGEDVDDF